jgi:hypothetical protein
MRVDETGHHHQVAEVEIGGEISDLDDLSPFGPDRRRAHFLAGHDAGASKDWHRPASYRKAV